MQTLKISQTSALPFLPLRVLNNYDSVHVFDG